MHPYTSTHTHTCLPPAPPPSAPAPGWSATSSMVKTEWERDESRLSFVAAFRRFCAPCFMRASPVYVVGVLSLLSAVILGSGSLGVWSLYASIPVCPCYHRSI